MDFVKVCEPPLIALVAELCFPSRPGWKTRAVIQCKWDLAVWVKLLSFLRASFPCSPPDLSSCLCVLAPAVQHIIQQGCCEGWDRPALPWRAPQWHILLLHPGGLLLQLHAGWSCCCCALHWGSLYPFEIHPLAAHVNQALKVNTSGSIRVCRDRNTHKWKCESAPDALISLILILHTVEIQEEKDIRSNKPFPSCRRLSHTLVREAAPGESVIHSLPQPSISFFISLLIPSLALRFSYCFNSKWRVHLWCWVKYLLCLWTAAKRIH